MARESRPRSPRVSLWAPASLVFSPALASATRLPPSASLSPTPRRLVCRRAERPPQLLASTDVVPEHVEQRLPLAHPHVPRVRLRQLRMNVHPQHSHLHHTPVAGGKRPR